MKLSEYLIECDHCGTQSKIIVIASNDEPYHCPMCGAESYFSLIDEEEDSDY